MTLKWSFLQLHHRGGTFIFLVLMGLIFLLPLLVLPLSYASSWEMGQHYNLSLFQFLFSFFIIFFYGSWLIEDRKSKIMPIFLNFGISKLRYLGTLYGNLIITILVTLLFHFFIFYFFEKLPENSLFEIISLYLGFFLYFVLLGLLSILSSLSYKNYLSLLISFFFLAFGMVGETSLDIVNRLGNPLQAFFIKALTYVFPDLHIYDKSLEFVSHIPIEWHLNTIFSFVLIAFSCVFLTFFLFCKLEVE
jgi:hypothetical protein